MLFFAKNIIFIFTLTLYDNGNADDGKKLFSSIHKFVMDVKNNSDGFVDFATKIYAVFCPNQPVCKKDGTWQEGKESLGDLPSYLRVGNSTVKLEDVHDIAGICCLPCSCSDDCQENNNCCPSKVHFENDTKDTESVKSECIVPISDSYVEKAQPVPGYFMITQCFKDLSNNTLVEKCEHPSAFRLAETGPVTSLKTGRTHWNKFCAICNRDADDIMKWNSSVTFPAGRSLIFFGNSTTFLYPDTFEELHRIMARFAEITYTPPFSMKSRVCLRNVSILSSCPNMESDDAVDDDAFLVQACQQFYNPVVYSTYLGREFTFSNIFCFFCEVGEIQPMENFNCQFEKSDNRGMDAKQMTAILDYTRHSELETITYQKKSKCPCSQVYDSFLGRCRALFCPLGEFLIGCECIQPLQNISGMPVLLKLRVIPKTSRANKMNRAQMGKYHTALEIMLQKTVKYITVTTLATLKQETEVGDYYLSMVIARSKPGHDTLKTIKPFLAYLDSDKQLDFEAGKMTYITKISNRILLWKGIVGETSTRKMCAKDLDRDDLDVDPVSIYTNNDYSTTNIMSGLYQSISPLLYCMQVKLDGSEYVEEDYRITINTTTPTISVPYYYKVGDMNKEVRICVNSYLPKHKNMGTRSDYNPTLSLITFSCMAIWCFSKHE